MNDDKFTLPAPGGALYVITLSGDCENCDAPAGIAIELIERTNILYREYKRGEFTNGPLKLEQWPDSKGAAIVTGLRKHEFIKAMMTHLVGVSSVEMGENGLIDEAGADVIAEEMYGDAQVQPHLV